LLEGLMPDNLEARDLIQLTDPLAGDELYETDISKDGRADSDHRQASEESFRHETEAAIAIDAEAAADGEASVGSLSNRDFEGDPHASVFESGQTKALGPAARNSRRFMVPCCITPRQHSFTVLLRLSCRAAAPKAPCRPAKGLRVDGEID
jgi:hypothetical protein